MVSQHTNNRRLLFAWLIVVAGSLLMSLLIVSAPLAVASDHNLVAATIYRAFGNLCHQLPERSFFIAGHQFAVCARCTGLDVGFTFAILLYPLMRPIRTAVVVKWSAFGGRFGFLHNARHCRIELATLARFSTTSGASDLADGYSI